MTEYVMITSMHAMHWKRVCILVSTPPTIIVSVPGEQSHLKVHKREKFFGSDFEFFTIL
jgi:hypothetical protein